MWQRRLPGVLWAMTTDLAHDASPATDADFLHGLLSQALKAGATDAVVSGNRGRTLNIEVRDGRFQDIVHEESSGISLTTYIGKRRASLGTNKLDRATLDTFVDRVIGMTRLAEEDPYGGLADPSMVVAPGNDDFLDLLDPVAPTAAELQAWAEQVESAARAVGRVSATQVASAGWQSGQAVLVASNGIDRSSSGSYFSAGTGVIAGTDNDRQVGFAGRAARWREDMPDLSAIGREAGENAAAKLGSRKLASGRAPVVIDRHHAMTVIGPMLGAIGGESIARGTSFLSDKLGQQVFSKGFTLTDNAFVPRGHGSRACDAEGLLPVPRSIVDDGVITTWLMSLRSARELGLQSTAHAGGLTNITVLPGARSREELMADVGTGLLVTDFMGQSLNPHTGDWAVGITGQWFENGEIAYSVSEVTIAGNLKDIYANLVVGSDLELLGAANCPSLLIPEMTISGA
jgi:PmbA protein